MKRIFDLCFYMADTGVSADDFYEALGIYRKTRADRVISQPYNAVYYELYMLGAYWRYGIEFSVPLSCYQIILVHTYITQEMERHILSGLRLSLIKWRGRHQ